MDRRKAAANQALQDLFRQFAGNQISEEEFMRVGARIISLGVGLSPQKIPGEPGSLPLDLELAEDG
jgi:hypothetical protein